MVDSKFVDDEELLGKTIKTVIASAGSVTLGFTDGSWTNIIYNGGYYVGEGEVTFDEVPHPDPVTVQQFSDGGFYNC